MKIKSFIEELAGEQREFPIVGLTATATQKVRTDIVERL
jgi:superfamily II DNA helicase RecQ